MNEVGFGYQQSTLYLIVEGHANQNPDNLRKLHRLGASDLWKLQLGPTPN